jgi:uncharacterized protein (TIGR02145 family)
MQGLGRAVMTGAAALTVLLVGSVTAQQKGTFTDSRDGQKYKTVKIGTQTWMAENMNVKTGTSWCYGDDESNCKKYGRLYAWSTAAKMACPNGWRLPSREEWDKLVKATGGEKTAGKKLKAKSGWNRDDDKNVSGDGTDDFGFSALPGGNRRSNGYFGDGYYSLWWSASDDGSDYANDFGINNGSDEARESSHDKSTLNSVRCLADN